MLVPFPNGQCQQRSLAVQHKYMPAMSLLSASERTSHGQQKYDLFVISPSSLLPMLCLPHLVSNEAAPLPFNSKGNTFHLCRASYVHADVSQAREPGPGKITEQCTLCALRVQPSMMQARLAIVRWSMDSRRDASAHMWPSDRLLCPCKCANDPMGQGTINGKSLQQWLIV